MKVKDCDELRDFNITLQHLPTKLKNVVIDTNKKKVQKGLIGI